MNDASWSKRCSSKRSCTKREPTAGLDPTERHRFLNLLAEIGSEVVVILCARAVKTRCTRSVAAVSSAPRCVVWPPTPTDVVQGSRLHEARDALLSHVLPVVADLPTPAAIRTWRVAEQVGLADTTMVVRVYARFRPNEAERTDWQRIAPYKIRPRRKLDDSNRWFNPRLTNKNGPPFRRAAHQAIR